MAEVGRVPVVYVIGTLDQGGAERQVMELATQLDRERFAAHVFCLSVGGFLQAEVEAAGIPVTVIGFRGFRIFSRPWRPWVGWRGMIRLVQSLRAVRPAIVHGYLFWAYILGTMAARLTRVPVVIASRRSLGTFKAGQVHYLLLERWTNAMTDLWVANSEAVRQDTARQEGVDPARIRVIPNGVDPDRFAGTPDRRAVRRRLGLLEDGPLLLFVGRLDQHKGAADLLRALPALAKRFPKLTAVLLGDGPAREELRSLTATLGVTTHVRLVGVADPIPFLQAADAFVLPTLGEGMSNALLEAMAAGLPCVTTRIPANLDLITHGDTGLLVEPANPEELQHANSRLLDNPDLSLRMGNRARQRVQIAYSAERMVAAYRNLFVRVSTGMAPPDDGPDRMEA